MKIALGVGYYYPDSIGGTEKYVHDLALYLISQNIEVCVIAPSSKGNYSYYHEEIKGQKYKVYRFEVPQEFTREEVADKVICRGWQNFENLLIELQPTIFHLHTLSTTLNYRHLKIAKKKGIHTLFTAHIPGVICPKGDFIKYPQQVCNGKIEHTNCGYCYAKWRHKNKWIAEITGRLAQTSFTSVILGDKISQFDVITKKKYIIKEIEKNSTYIIAVCNWLYSSFLINDISPNHLKICRQGVSTSYLEKVKKENLNKEEIDIRLNKKIKIGFIGRLEPIKGLHILLEEYQKAIIENPNLNIELDIVGVKQAHYLDYYAELQKKIKSLANIVYQENLPPQKVSLFMAKLDYLCIPSTCLETGPIVAYEAFANQVPIIGANIGGVAELVEDKKTGFLYPFDKPNTLKDIFLEINNNPIITSILKKNIQSPRTTKEVGEEMLVLYNSLDTN